MKSWESGMHAICAFTEPDIDVVDCPSIINMYRHQITLRDIP